MPYATVQDIRDAGVTEEQASDVEVEALLALCSTLIDEACGQWFEPRTIDAVFDGTGSSLLQLPVPIIEITSLRINDEADELDPECYRAYTSRTLPDDRRNPRIRLLGDRCFNDDGYQNQAVSGTFGFLEPDNSTPAMIVRATIKLVLERIGTPAAGGTGSGGSTTGPVGPVVEEWTDGHKLKWATPKLTDQRSGLISISSDPEVQLALRLYRRPISVRGTR